MSTITNGGAPTFQEIKQAIQELGKATHEMQEANNASEKALRDGQTALARELAEVSDKWNKEITQVSEFKKRAELEQALLRDRLEEVETRHSSPGKTMVEQRRGEHKGAFMDWVRRPTPMAEAKLQDAERKLAEVKDVTIGTGAAGGFAVPEEIAREIGRLELLFSPVRSLVKVVQVGTADYKELVSKRGTTSGWVGETATRTATATPQLRERAPTFGELYAYPQASEWSLDDIFFNVENWLAEEIAQEFAQEEGIAVISGNGTSKPTGMLNTAPVATADFASPERNAAAYQLVTSDLTPGGVGILGDALIDLAATLNSAYRSRATWVMNSLSEAAIRKVKDSTGQYIWQPGLQLGNPNMLLSRPVAIWEHVPNVGANAFCVGFGDWNRAYVLADRVGLRITRDNVTNVGFVRFYVRRREGGTVLDNHASKWLQTL